MVVVIDFSSIAYKVKNYELIENTIIQLGLLLLLPEGCMYGTNLPGVAPRLAALVCIPISWCIWTGLPQRKVIYALERLPIV